MLPGWEEFTKDITEEEHSIAEWVAKGLRARVGKEKAITNRAVRKVMKERGIKNGDPFFRKIVQYIRSKNMVPNLIASSKGYYVARDDEEFAKYMSSFEKRVREMQYTMACLRFYNSQEKNVKQKV